MQEEACRKKGRTCISQVAILKEDKIKIDTLWNASFFLIQKGVFSQKNEICTKLNSLQDKSNFGKKKVSKWLQHIIDHIEKKTFHSEDYFAFKISRFGLVGWLVVFLSMKLNRD